MKNEGLIYVLAAALCAGWLLTPAPTHAAKYRNLNISSNGTANSCADLKVSSKDGEVSQVTQSFTLSRAEAPILEMNSADRGQIRVHGADRADYGVETCRIAVAETRAEADQIARAIGINHAAGNITYNGPAGDSGEWQVVFFIQAPRDASVNLESKNGPIEVSGINGSVKLRATNGPIAVSDCGGFVDVQTTNGPIAFSGDRGDVRLHAQNGPIALKFGAADWSGPQLEARADNGPMAINLPDNFRTSVRLETSGHSPFACNSPLCRNAFTESARGGSQTMRFNGSSDIIRLFTDNGPVAVSSNDGRKAKF